MVKIARLELRWSIKAFWNHEERGKAIRIEEVYEENEKTQGMEARFSGCLLKGKRMWRLNLLPGFFASLQKALSPKDSKVEGVSGVSIISLGEEAT